MMTARELMEKIFTEAYDSLMPTQSIAKIESLLSAALAEAQAKGAFLAAEEGLKVVKESRAEAFEEAARIAERQSHAYKPEMDMKLQIAAEIRRRAGEAAK